MTTILQKKTPNKQQNPQTSTVQQIVFKSMQHSNLKTKMNLENKM